MPRTGDILDGLSAIANQATGVAIAWHMLIATALVALVSGWRPPPRTARLLIGIPLASVAVRRHRICESIQWAGLHRECVGDDCACDPRRTDVLSGGDQRGRVHLV
jgi:hypothetical protein